MSERKLIHDWPFPVAAPPPRRPVTGLFLAAVGNILIVIGFLGMGLVANAVVFPEECPGVRQFAP